MCFITIVVQKTNRLFDNVAIEENHVAKSEKRGIQERYEEERKRREKK